MKNTLFLFLFFISTVSDAQWIIRDTIPIARQEAPAIILNNKIYSAGGISTSLITLQTVDIYDPLTDSWSAGIDLPVPRHHHAMCTLNGKIYMMGGYQDLSFIVTDSVYMYDPDSSMWFTKTSLPFAIAAGDAIAFNGKIYLIGGANGGTALTTCLEYDPVADTWTQKSDMPTAREHLCVVLADTLIYAIAGRGSLGAETRVEVYNPSNDSWSVAPNLPTGRSGCDGASVNGKIFVMGGELPGVFNKNEMYDPDSMAWFTLANMPHARHGLGVVAAGDTIYAIGGATIAGYAACNFNEAFLTNGFTLIAEHDLQQTISFFPNPVKNELNITGCERLTGENLIVCDIYGRILLEMPVTTSACKLQITNFISGIYF